MANDTPTARFGKRLRKLREANGLTQLELGDRAKLGSLAISRYELGKQEPKADSILALANALGVSTDALLVDAHDASAPTSDDSPGPVSTNDATAAESPGARETAAA